MIPLRMEGKPKRVLNQNETTLAQQKQQAIKDAFANWVWKDPQRRALLVKQYNELFNSTRPREYDGSHIHFVGMNPEITFAGAPAQRDCSCALWVIRFCTRSRCRQDF